MDAPMSKNMRTGFTGTFSILLTCMASSLGLSTTVDNAAGKEKPNFLIIVADDVSWSDFGCMRSGCAALTPNIDRLASQGIRFNNFFCGSAQCTPLRHELFTGLLPATTGVYDNINRGRDYKNYAEYLIDLGYTVGLAGKSCPLSHQRIVRVEGFVGGCNDRKPTWSLDGVRKFISSSEAANKPFCVMIGSVHAHHPWTVGDASKTPPDGIVVPDQMVDGPITRRCLSLHAAEVGELDNQVGAVMAMLKELNLDQKTVLIFLSEQGKAMPNGKWSVYDYGCRALCTVRWPGTIEAGAVTDEVAMYCDILPTLVDLAGGPPPEDIDGYSLRKLLVGESRTHHRQNALMFGQKCLIQRAIRTKDFKLIWNPDRSSKYYQKEIMSNNSRKFFHKAWAEWVRRAATDPDARAKVDHVLKHPEFELYDIRRDPFETNNLAALPEHEQRVKQMFEDLTTRLTKLNDPLLKKHTPPRTKRIPRETIDD